MERYIYKRFYFLVDQAGISYNKKFNLDKSIVQVHGLHVGSDNPELLFFRGSQRIEINGDEIFEEDYPCRELMSGSGVPPDHKHLALGNGVIAGNGEVKVLFKDTNHLFVAFSPYLFELFLKCEIK